MPWKERGKKLSIPLKWTHLKKTGRNLKKPKSSFKENFRMEGDQIYGKDAFIKIS
jgi:hypothetical protein